MLKVIPIYRYQFLFVYLFQIKVCVFTSVVIINSFKKNLHNCYYKDFSLGFNTETSCSLLIIISYYKQYFKTQSLITTSILLHCSLGWVR